MANAKVLLYRRDATPSQPASEEPARRRQQALKKKIVTLDISPTDALRIENARGAGPMSLRMRFSEDG